MGCRKWPQKADPGRSHLAVERSTCSMTLGILPGDLSLSQLLGCAHVKMLFNFAEQHHRHTQCVLILLVL